MKKTLRGVLDLPGCEKMQVIAGENGLNREVRWISTVDSPDIVPFTNPGDLNFVTGVGTRGDEDLMAITLAAYERELAGLVFCPDSPYIEKVPQAIIDFGNDNDFPILTIPWNQKISDLSRNIGRFISVGFGTMRTLTSALRDILTGKEGIPLDQETKYILQIYHVDPDDDFLMALFTITPGGGEKDEAYREMYDDLQTMLTKRFTGQGIIVPLERGLAIMFRGRDVLLNIDDLQKKMIKEVEELRTCFPAYFFTLGIGSVHEGIKGACESYHEAMLVTNIYSDKQQSEKQIYQFDKLGSYQALYLTGNPRSLIDYSNRMLDPVLLYDKQNDAGLMNCLNVFFENGCNVKRTSEQLFLHRNTVLYKIKKIEELIEGRLFDQQTMFDLQLAMMVRKMYRIDR